MIQLRNVTAARSGRRLFHHFNLSINPGEHWVIQGPNGAGKTLLLQLIAGVLHPLEGDVHHSFISPGDWNSVHRQRLENINTTLVMITHDEKDVAEWTQLRKQL